LFFSSQQSQRPPPRSERDHFNSNGERLRTAAAIIRQDRVNFFGLRDSADQDDVFFTDVNNRAALESLIERGTSEPHAINRIVNGTPMVRVDIFFQSPRPVRERDRTGLIASILLCQKRSKLKNLNRGRSVH
jgi:hypothetical protein